MKKTLDWHHTPLGGIVLWLGSIQLAVPILAVTAVALAVGTYIDSTDGAQAAARTVYGAGWFIAIMGLVCVSLVFAVISRYPWKRRHVGFITVHAGLIALILGGFWSLFGRVEGQLGLTEGQTSATIETRADNLELVEHQAGQFRSLATEPAPFGAASIELAGHRIQVVERWENCRDEEVVADDAPLPFRGVRISAGHSVPALWIGEEERGGGAPTIAGLRIRVLPDGVVWQPEPPAAEAESPGGYEFRLGNEAYPLAEEGQEAFPGWTIASIRRFERAMVGGEGLTENAAGPPNPAVDVTIADGKGSTERHTAFLNFPEMVMNRMVEGSTASGAKLGPTAAAPAAGGETLIIHGPIEATRFAYIGADGAVQAFDDPAPLPRTLDVGMRHINIVQQFARARGGWRTVRAPKASENRPALVLRHGDSTELTVLPWKGTSPVPSPAGDLMLRFGPRQVDLPFSVRLIDFRKSDYPGTQMAMAYESDVAVTIPGRPEVPFRIHMNNPYAHGPWKVYQSGFVGDSTSIFSVMRDPGIPLTYTGATVLCIGIIVTFFSRSLSWGHPGIPIGHAEKESPHAPLPPAHAGDPLPAVAGDPPGDRLARATGGA